MLPGMDVFFGYGTALAYLRLAAMDDASGRPAAWRADELGERFATSSALPVNRNTRDYARDALKPAGWPDPLLPAGLVVPSAGARGQSDLYACHVWRPPLPDGAFWALSPDTFVSSPEFCFAQMARQLSVGRLALLGFELCGSYALAKDGPGFRPRAPLTSVARLAAFVAALGSFKGVKHARAALSFLIDGAASPMESVLVALLCAPGRLGGYGLPLPQLNARIQLPPAARSMTRSTYFSCDLLWPEARLAVEYDSTLFHTGAERIAADSERRNALAYLGIDVVSVTRDQLMGPLRMDRVVHLPRKALSIEFDPVTDDAHLRASLRRELLGRR